MKTSQSILNQLGGNRFIAMTGSKNFVDLGNGLSMSLTRNKINAKWLNITLDENDTYTMEFLTADKSLNIKTKAKFENIYCDMLENIFSQTTGLFTRF